MSTPDLIKMIAGEMKNLNQVKTRGRVYFSCFKFWKNRNVPCFHQEFAGVEGAVYAGKRGFYYDEICAGML